jgi:hypothetical protein
MTTRRFAVSVALAAALALVAPSAYAFDANAALDRLKAMVAEQGMDLQWTAANPQGEGFVLDGVSIGMPDQDERLPIGQVTLADISQEDDDIIRIGSITLPSFEMSAPDDGHVSVKEVAVEGLELPGPATTDEVAKLGFYEKTSIGSAEIAVKGAKIFTMQDLEVNAAHTDGGGMEFEGGIDTIAIDMTQAPDPKARETMAAFGYETLSGGISFSGAWDPNTGDTKIDDYSFTVDDAGTLGMTLDVSGYTLNLVKQLREMSKKMNAAGMTEDEKSMQGLAMLGMMQGLTFTSATLRFDDDGLTTKALDYAGKKQGMSATDVANQAKAVVPFMLAQLQNPEFTAQVSEAVNAFMDNPHSIEISAKPATPQPLSALMAAGMGDPKSLITTLGVTVKANE